MHTPTVVLLFLSYSLYLTSLGNIIRLGRVIKCATSILIVYLVRFNDFKKMRREEMRDAAIAKKAEAPSKQDLEQQKRQDR